MPTPRALAGYTATVSLLFLPHSQLSPVRVLCSCCRNYYHCRSWTGIAPLSVRPRFISFRSPCLASDVHSFRGDIRSSFPSPYRLTRRFLCASLFFSRSFPLVRSCAPPASLRGAVSVSRRVSRHSRREPSLPARVSLRFLLVACLSCVSCVSCVALPLLCRL